MSAIRLTRQERTRIAREARRELRRAGHDGGYGLYDAAAFIEERIDALGRFADLPYTEISDYAHGLAAWVAPKEAAER